MNFGPRWALKKAHGAKVVARDAIGHPRTARWPGAAGHLRHLRLDFSTVEAVFGAVSKLKAKDMLEFPLGEFNQRVDGGAARGHALALERA
jgi:hypothetical protein